MRSENVPPARALQLGDDAVGVVAALRGRVREREPAADRHRRAVVGDVRVAALEHVDRVVDLAELQRARARARRSRRRSRAAVSSSSSSSSVSRIACAASGRPCCRSTQRLEDLGERAHALVGHVAGDRAVVRERRRRTRRRDRARRARARPEPVAITSPQRSPISWNSAIASRPRSTLSRHPAAPQRDVGEQHVHHADGPAVAGLAAVDRDVLGERGGLVEPALVVADEREQSVGPAEPAPVAELAEQVGRLLRAGSRRGGMLPLRERDPREVLQRPRRAALVARRAERARAPRTRTARPARGRRGRDATCRARAARRRRPPRRRARASSSSASREGLLGDVVRADVATSPRRAG